MIGCYAVLYSLAARSAVGVAMGSRVPPDLSTHVSVPLSWVVPVDVVGVVYAAAHEDSERCWQLIIEDVGSRRCWR